MAHGPCSVAHSIFVEEKKQVSSPVCRPMRPTLVALLSNGLSVHALHTVELVIHRKFVASRSPVAGAVAHIKHTISTTMVATQDPRSTHYIANIKSKCSVWQAQSSPAHLTAATRLPWSEYVASTVGAFVSCWAVCDDDGLEMARCASSSNEGLQDSSAPHYVRQEHKDIEI